MLNFIFTNFLKEFSLLKGLNLNPIGRVSFLGHSFSLILLITVMLIGSLINYELMGHGFGMICEAITIAVCMFYTAYFACKRTVALGLRWGWGVTVLIPYIGWLTFAGLVLIPNRDGD